MADAGAVAPDASLATLRTCPGVADCFLLTPVETGLPDSGKGATENHIALVPAAAAAKGRLLVFLNGSGGTPAGAVATTTNNFYTAARDAGLHVLALSYRSDVAVGILCPPSLANRDGCYEPTRLTLLAGQLQAGAAAGVADIQPDEGVFARLAAALSTLAAADPGGGWSAFLDGAQADPEQAIRWNLVWASGHSQGGGHAALLGKRLPLDRVISLAAPCDAVASSPATWMTRTATFQTEASRFYGLASSQDTTICPMHAAAWTALELPTANQNDAAQLCAGVDAHSAPLKCTANSGLWQELFK
ncbi:MAG: hypothetical protein QM765_32170 [Myxococcales bacterium]